MKIKHLILSALAVASIAVSCKKEEASDKPSLTLNPTELSFEVAGGTQTVTVEANRDWSISDPDKIASWLTVEKKSDTEVEVTAAKNDGKDRTAEVTLRMVGVKKSISISQKGEGGSVEPVEEGDGSKEKPYTAAQALAVTSALEKDAKTDKEYYVKGIVCEVKEVSTQYGNATFWISDDGSNDKETRFYVFRAKDTNGASITDANRVKVGDVVVVYGLFQNYYGNTPQLSQGGQIVSVNGGDTPDTPVVEEKTATGVVVALNSKGFLIKTDAGITYVFDSSKTPEVEIGDNVTVKGTETVYNGTPEITSYTVTVNSKGNAVTHPDATEITSDNIATYETLFGYVKTTGALTISSKGYYNLAVEGATKTVSLAYPVGVDASFDGKNINVEGYYVGLTGNGSYFNIVVTAASLSDIQPEIPDQPDMEGKYFVKVNSSEALSGSYLIVYENSETEAIAFNGKDESANHVAAAISDKGIAYKAELANCVVTIASVEGGYSILLSTGKYIGGTSGKNTIAFSAAAVVNTITYKTDAFEIASNTSILTYNSATSNGDRFRYYKTATVGTGTGTYKYVQLYKLAE